MDALLRRSVCPCNVSNRGDHRDRVGLATKFGIAEGRRWTHAVDARYRRHFRRNESIRSRAEYSCPRRVSSAPSNLFRGDVRLVAAAYISGERRIAASGLRYSNAAVFDYVRKAVRLYEQNRLKRFSSLPQPESEIRGGNFP